MDAIDTSAPWTIKSCPNRIREAVTTAARKEGLTVGQWLERRVDEWLEQGSPTRQAYPVADLVSLATVAAQLAHAPDAPVVKTARLAVRRAMLGQTMAEPRSARAITSEARAQPLLEAPPSPPPAAPERRKR